MISFEDKFVRFRWSDDLAGKKCLYGDSIDILELDFNKASDVSGTVTISTNFTGIVTKNTNPCTSDYPFAVSDAVWKFVYYDPNLECKKAYEQGKQIQCLNVSGEWIDCEPHWSDATQYRIKPEEPNKRATQYRIKPEEPNKRATYRELSEWLAKGNGQYRLSLAATRAFIFMDYPFNADEEEVPEDYLVRPWGSDKWFVPTKEVLNG